MLTVKEVAERLQVSKGAVYKAIATGRLGHHRIGACIRVSESQLQQFLETARVEPMPNSPRERDLIAKHLGA